MAIPRAFISFEMEDKYARDFLVQQAKSKDNRIEFVDYSVKDPWDTSWKTNCRERIARTKGTIVLIGPTTHTSEAVIWEIAETTRQRHHIFGIQVNRDRTFVAPSGLASNNVIRWDFAQIVTRLEAWN